MSKEKVGLVLKNTLTSMPYTIYVASLLAFLITGDNKYGLFFIFAILLGDGANMLEKKLFKMISKQAEYGKRPSGCGTRNGKVCTGCGIYSNPLKSSKTWGMPSGHTQITALAATFWTPYLIGKNKDKKIKRLEFRIILLWVVAIMVWIQRIYSRCHSLFQVGSGAVIGIGFGILSYYLCRKINKDKFPETLFIK